jgi:membrane fusion protein, type I secretion system
MRELRLAASPRGASIRFHLIGGIAAVAVLVFGVGGWAATARLSGAVIAPGVLVVDSNVKTIQHPTGGIVGELFVKDGDRVKAGDILIRLDATKAQSNLDIVTKNIDELAARRARLEAEQDGDDAPDFPQDLLDRQNDPEVAKLLAGESKLFQVRATTRDGQKAQLRERMQQLQEEIGGLTAQIDSKDREISLIKTELEGIRGLWAKDLVPITRVTEVERDLARLQGERGQLLASVAQARGKITETDLQVLQIDQDMRSKVGDDLADVRAKMAELGERKTAAEDELRRIEIRAPQEGTVHELAVHTVGGVIAAGDVIMRLVPDEDQLRVEAKIPPQEIDRVTLNQPALLRFTSFDTRSTPEINGKVSLVSAATSFEQKTGLSYYTVHVSIADDEISRLGHARLLPGMPVEVFIETGERTLASYLAKPLVDQFERALKER